MQIIYKYENDSRKPEKSITISIENNAPIILLGGIVLVQTATVPLIQGEIVIDMHMKAVFQMLHANIPIGVQISMNTNMVIFMGHMVANRMNVKTGWTAANRLWLSLGICDRYNREH